MHCSQRNYLSGARVQDREREWADLMRASIAGDATAYHRLLRDLAYVLRVRIRRMLARARMPVTDAEDIVQEVLLAIHLKRHTWNPRFPIGPWIQAIARNKFVDAMRRRGARRFELPIDDVAESLPADEEPVASVSGDIDRHVDALPSRQRAVVRAIAVECASIRETARKLGMTEGAVRVALHRGLSALAARIGGLTR
jgi:RNA polymerase sigma-70 factor (ECF subfamily)